MNVFQQTQLLETLFHSSMSELDSVRIQELLRSCYIKINSLKDTRKVKCWSKIRYWSDKGFLQSEIAALFNISQSTVWNILSKLW